VHYAQDDSLPTFEGIAPTAVYDVTAPGSWPQALTALGAGLGHEPAAAEIIAGYQDQ